MNYLASRSRLALSRSYHLLVSYALCSSWFSPEKAYPHSMSIEYAVVIPVYVRSSPLRHSAFAQSTGIRSDTVFCPPLRRACGASCIRLYVLVVVVWLVLLLVVVRIVNSGSASGNWYRL